MFVDKDEEAKEDHWEASLGHLPEQQAVQSQVKGLGHVHGTGEHLRAIVQVPVYSLQHSPGTHGGGAASLISKLKII